MVQGPGSLGPTTGRYFLELLVISSLLSRLILDCKKNKRNNITYREQATRLGKMSLHLDSPDQRDTHSRPTQSSWFFLPFPGASEEKQASQMPTQHLGTERKFKPVLLGHAASLHPVPKRQSSLGNKTPGLPLAVSLKSLPSSDGLWLPRQGTIRALEAKEAGLGAQPVAGWQGAVCIH